MTKNFYNVFRRSSISIEFRAKVARFKRSDGIDYLFPICSDHHIPASLHCLNPFCFCPHCYARHSQNHGVKDRGLSRREDSGSSVAGEDSFNKVLANPEIKGIAIATPAATHAGMVRDAILAGKDVYVEKPLCLSEKEGI